jgi:predicted membrane GTPase involved in stress response
VSYNCINTLRQRVRILDITNHRQRLTTALFNQLAGCVQLAGRATGDRHPGTLCCQRQGDALTYSLPRAGDKGNFSVQYHFSLHSLLNECMYRCSQYE